MNIGIYGSSSETKQELKEKAREIGRQIAKRNCTLITGASMGLPHEAVLATNELGGKTIGYSPATDIKIHVKRDHYPTNGFSKIIFIPKNYEHAKDPVLSRMYRIISFVNAIDAAIIIGGRVGTMIEFAMTYHKGKNIGVLEGSGGITNEAISSFLKAAESKATGSKVIYDPNPKTLVDRIIEISK